MELYAIKHVVSGKAYVGSTVNRKERHQTHLRMLRRGVHHCEHLQRAWSKYGEQAFVFLTIGKCETIKELREVEQAFLECFFGDTLYNGKCSATGFPTGDSHPAKRADWHQKHVRDTLTDEQRKEKYGASGKGRKRDHDTYSAGAKKQWNDPEQRAKKMAAMRGKREIVECPHCGKTGGGGNMRRYHFEKCKSK
jgi:group I intron endonuclease